MQSTYTSWPQVESNQSSYIDKSNADPTFAPNCIGMKWEDFESKQHSKRLYNILCWNLKDSLDETEIGSKLTTRCCAQ